MEVILTEKDGRFIVVDKKGFEYSNCARRSDAKKVFNTKKGQDLVLVEKFSKDEPTVTSNHKTYKAWILENVEEDDRHSKSSKLKEFADHFNVTYYEKYNRCRVFENTIKRMNDEDL